MRRAKRWPQAASIIARLVLALGVLPFWCACERVFVPLDQQDAAQSGQPDGPESVLVRLAVCWEALPLAQDLVAAHVTDASLLSIELIPTHSAEASEIVAADQADLAIVGLPPDFEATDVGSNRLAARPLALNAIGIIVHPASSLKDISTEELSKLYGGYVLDWGELAPGSAIEGRRPELVGRDQDSVVTQIFESVVMFQDSVSSAAIIMPHDQAVADYVAEHRAAVGYVSTAYVDDRVRLVALDGVLPTSAEVVAGRYPLSYPLFLLLSPKAPPEASRLLAYALGSRGRAIVRRRYALAR